MQTNAAGKQERRAHLFKLSIAGLISSLLIYSSAGAAEAAAQAKSQALSIPAQSLSSALTSLSKQTGVQIYANGDLVQGKTTTAVSGQLTAQDALNQLLQGTGLRAVPDSGNNFTIQKKTSETDTLPEVSVSSKKEVEPGIQAEGKASDGYLAKTISSLGPLGAKDLLDTPYSVSVVPKELISNIQAQSPDDIYRLNPSTRTTTPQITAYSPVVNIRGFDGYNTAEDGLRRPYNHVAVLEDKERVEILNGLSGFLFGAANPGGMVNFVSKRPTVERLNSVTLGNYGGDQYYAHGDFGGRIDEAGRAGYRLNVVKQEGNTALDYQSINRSLISGAVDWQLTDKLLLELNAVYNDYQTKGNSTYWSFFTLVPGIKHPSAPDTRKQYGQKWNNDSFENKEATGKLTYQLNDQVTLRGAYTDKTLDRDAHYGTQNYAFTSTDYFQRASRVGDQTFTYKAAYAFADFKFDTGPLSHQLTAGYYMFTDELRASNYSVSAILGPFSIEDPQYVARPSFAAETQGRFLKSRTLNENFTIGDTIKINEQWSALLGVNRSSILAQNYSNDDVKSQADYDKTRTSPAASLIYKPLPWLSTYASYIEGLEQGGRAPLTTNNPNILLSPMISRQQEIGVKAKVGGMLLSSAIFRIEKAYEYIDSTDNIYKQNGRQNHKGIEFNATGRATERLTLISGLTLLDPTIKKSEFDGKEPFNVAKQLAKVYAEYDVPALPGLTLTGGVFYTGKQWADEENTDRLAAYTTVDVGARYTTTVSRRPLTLRLNVSNLTDKDYWLNSYYLGTPRNIAFSAQMQF